MKESPYIVVDKKTKSGTNGVQFLAFVGGCFLGIFLHWIFFVLGLLIVLAAGAGAIQKVFTCSECGNIVTEKSLKCPVCSVSYLKESVPAEHYTRNMEKSTVEERLMKLKELTDKGLIDEQEYHYRKREIIGEI